MNKSTRASKKLSDDSKCRCRLDSSPEEIGDFDVYMKPTAAR